MDKHGGREFGISFSLGLKDNLSEVSDRRITLAWIALNAFVTLTPISECAVVVQGVARQVEVSESERRTRQGSPVTLPRFDTR